MKVKTEDLLNALTNVKPALAGKAIMEQTDHFIFDDTYLRTYNDKIAISYPFETGINGAIKADEFYKLVSKITAKDLEMGLNDDGKLVINAGTTEAEIMTHDEIACPIIEVQAKRWNKLAEGFENAAYFCSFSAAKTLAVVTLTCLWLKDDMIISTDRFRASRYKVKGKIPQVLLPASVIKELKGYEPEKFVLENSWAHFKNKEGAIFSCRIIDGEYPERVLDIFEPNGDNIKLPADLKGKIDIAKIFPDSDEDKEDVTIEVSKGKMTIVGESAIGKIKETTKIKYNKKGFKFEVSPEALQEIIAHTDEMIVGEDSLYFAGENFEHVISLR
jgi:hypothetical protein